MLKFFSILSIILIFTGCGYNRKEISRVSPIIKILLFQGKEVRINPYRNYVISAHSRKEMWEGPIYLELSNRMICLNEMPLGSGDLEIVPAEYFSFQGRKYRGSLTVHIDGNELMVINQLDIESYIYGVLPNEISTEWNSESLKAQAVVSRTFALFEVTTSRKTGRPYDVYDDTRSQVYNGMDRESRFTTMAVDTTSGEVVRFQGKIVQAFFHSASGGMTESSKEAFGFDYPYLVPVISPYGNVYRDNQWEIKLPLNRLQQALNLRNAITNIQVTERTASKRIKTLAITETDGKKTTVTANNFRNAVGNTVMKSTRANIRILDQTVMIAGMGYGHGVGMGQWDAQGMALQGYRYQDILSYFYPGTRIERVW